MEVLVSDGCDYELLLEEGQTYPLVDGHGIDREVLGAGASVYPNVGKVQAGAQASVIYAQYEEGLSYLKAVVRK